MARAQRLLALMQELRRHRYPVTGTRLAGALGISARTLYRDIATLRGQGADIEGEAGVGYLLRPGFVLPPLMLSDEEAEALLLGARWVARRGDEAQRAAAAQAMAKIAAVLPAERRSEMESSTLLVAVPRDARNDEVLQALRRAIRAERRVRLQYRDEKGHPSQRAVWPFALGYFEQVRMLLAWCELRADYRSFRIDRIEDCQVGEEAYPRRRHALLREWREREGVEAPAF
ncbi:helix-turn-helix transcriptional regulator [Bordetella hinzii]|uniref:helix-turn-helix transcriptional regulator n=1 Tax=Bordetella hinzii TaxID=103855 RepID=UPI003F1AAE8B